jgi:hypothetical protein
MQTPSYPQTRYEPAPLVELTCQEERERLSPGAIRAFLNIMEKWRVCDEDAREILGGVSQDAFDDMKAVTSGEGTECTLEADRLLRISLLIGIFKAVGILHRETLADRWVHLPNTNRIFDGRTPLAYMIEGGLLAIQTVRRLLDARCSGR